MSDNSAYIVAKAAKAQIEERVTRTSKILRAIPGVGSGPMGLTPDAVRASPEYRIAKAEFDAAFAALQTFNQRFHKAFATEIKAERCARDKARCQNS